ncbi:MAG: Calx-beta domain-containing protein, partial [Pseudohongiellaceae bacterium]
SLVESDETLTLRFNNKDNIADTGFTGGNLAATGTITDNEMPTLSISAVTSPITEGTNAVFIITSTYSPMHDTVIGVTGVEAGSFVAGTLPTAVTLAANEITAALTIATIDDNTDEADGEIALVFNIGGTLPNYRVGSASAARVNIADNDGPAIFVANASAAETDGQLVFAVTMSDKPVEQTEVSWTTKSDGVAGASPARVGASPARVGARAARAGASPARVDASPAVAGTSPAMAAGDADYIAADGTLTFAAYGSTVMGITVVIRDDNEVEPDEIMMLRLLSATNDASIVNAIATGTIGSEDVPGISITADQPAVTEGGAAMFTVVADQRPVADLTVNIGTTVVPVDFRGGAAPATVTFVAGVTTAAYRVNTRIVDGTGTGTITVAVNEGSSAYTAVAPVEARVTVFDSSVRTISVSGPDTVDEDSATVEFTVMLSSPPASTGHTVTVDYATADDAAIAGSDYTAASGTLTFAGSEISKTVTVTILNDTAYENPNEQFQIELSNPQPTSGNQLLGTGMADVDIVDDDQITLSIAPATDKASVAEAPGATLAYEVSFPSSGATQVQNNLALNYTVTGNATSNTDYTAPSGSLTFSSSDGTNQTVLVTLLDDDIVEGGETVILTLGLPTQPRITLATGSSSATGTITDDEMPTLSISAITSPITEGTDAIFVITSTNSPMNDTVIGIAGTEEGDFVTNKTLPTSVTIAANETTATLTFATTDDDTDEADGSLTLRLNLGDTLPNYTAGSGATAGNRATINIEDNDGPVISIASASARESAGQLVFAVSLNAAPAEHTAVHWTTADDTVPSTMQATAGTDYSIARGILTFAPGITTLNVSVNIVDDIEVESSETFLLILSQPGSDATLHPRQTLAIGTIIDDDKPRPVITIVASTSAITEGETAVFSIGASLLPTESLTIFLNVTEEDSRSMRERTHTLTLPAGITNATFTVATIDDDMDELDGAIIATLVTDSGSPPVYNLGTPATARVTVRDNDLTELSIAAVKTPITEGEPATFRITSSTPPPPNMTISMTVTQVGDFISKTPPATMQFRPGETIEILYIATDDDEEEESDGLITVTLNADSNYKLNGNPSADVVMLDNDRFIDAVEQVNKDILPYLAITMADEATWAIRGRIETAFADNRSQEFLVQGSGLGQFVIKQLQQAANKQGSQESLRLMPHDIEFSFNLDATDDRRDANAASPNSLNNNTIPDFGSETGSREWWHRLTLWGRGYQHKLSVAEGSTHFNGTVQGGMIGLDSVAPGFLGGIMLNKSSAELEFQHANFNGIHKTDIRGIQPYFAWEYDSGFRLWTTLGYSKGDIEVIANDKSNARYASDIIMQTLSLGASNPLLEARRTDSSTKLSLIGHGVFARVEEEIQDSVALEAGRWRMGFELIHKRFTEAGPNISSSLQLAWREDFGDAMVANGVEVSGGLALVSASGLRFSLVGRTLHTSKYGVEEWGVGGDFSWTTGEDGRGLSVTFKPHWGGGTASQQQQFWGTGLLNSNQRGGGNNGGNAMGYKLEFKYGIPFRRDDNMLTLFASSDIQSANKTLALGANLKLQQGLSAGYEAFMQPGFNEEQAAMQANRQATSPFANNTSARSYAQPGSAAYQSYLQSGRTDYNPLMWLGETQHPLLTPDNNGFKLPIPNGAGQQSGTTQNADTGIIHRAYLKYVREF